LGSSVKRHENARHFLLIEEASLELLPQKYYGSLEAKKVLQSFGVQPAHQILDRNYHSKIVSSLKEDQVKRGRPDVTHLALLDITSTPLFQTGGVEVFVRTRSGLLIGIKKGTRLPRTLQRFCGVMTRLLSGSYGEAEMKLFTISRTRDFADVVSSLRLQRVISLSSRGEGQHSLRELVQAELSNEFSTGWIVGGFPHGHFRDEVVECSDLVASISRFSLPAHVVTARITYELECGRKSDSK
jgi:rRNA pseudouridine-1189 N-methylase Emg1 (Nep1/Mra1 family)